MSSNDTHLVMIDSVEAGWAAGFNSRLDQLYTALGFAMVPTSDHCAASPAPKRRKILSRTPDKQRTAANLALGHSLEDWDSEEVTATPVGTGTTGTEAIALPDGRLQ